MCPHLRLRRPANECVLFRPTVQCQKTARRAPGAATAKGTGVDPAHDITTADLSFDEEARDLWEPALPHLAQALAGSEGAFLDALESAGRGAGLTQKVPIADVLDAYGRGSELVRGHLLRSGGPDAEAPARSPGRAAPSDAHAHSGRLLRRPGRDHRPPAARRRRESRRSTSTAAPSSPASSVNGCHSRSSVASAWTCRSGCSSWPSPRAAKTGATAATACARRPASDRELSAGEPAPLRQRGPHRRRRLRAGPPGHQPARARGGGGASPPRARLRVAATTAGLRSSRSRWRTTISSTRTRRRCSPSSAAACTTPGRPISPSPGRRDG